MNSMEADDMSGFFTVYDKKTFEEVKVYAVKDDKTGQPHFLIYEDNEWKYKSAKHFYEVKSLIG